MRRNKKLIIIGLIIVLLVATGLITSYIDSARVRNSVEPKYTIKIVSDDGSKVTYFGLGYKVIRYVNVSPNEPYKNNRGVRYGNWFMKYELEQKNDNTTLDELNEVNDIIIKYFTSNDIEYYENYIYNYVDESNKVVIVGLLDNSKEKQDEFKRLVVDSDLIRFEKGERNVNQPK